MAPNRRAERRRSAQLTANSGGQASLTRIDIKSEFKGPLPHPEHLAAYQSVYDDAAKMIFASADRQSAHRQSLERLGTEAAIDYRRRGQLMSSALLGVVIVGGVVLTALGKDLAGLGSLIVSGSVAIGNTVWRRVEDHRERQEQRRLDREARSQPPAEGREPPAP